MRKKLLNITLKLAAFAILALGSSVMAAPATHAWDAGRIIDDSVFNNSGSMSVQDIQNFLNSKVPTCDTYHAPDTRYSQGANPPWTCLKNYNEGGRSAAQIIYDAAQQYSINPQVILVTLQKENGLITDTWPYPWQYKTAMGFGCPDGAPCDAQWFGFTNQVNQGARHLRNFQIQTPGWTIPHRPGVNFIQYNPNSGCGGSNVNIVNGATSALYSYTPYQPNAAALATKYGTGDGCSAYGNRNFYNYFTDWFGNTYGQPYSWQVVSQTYSKGSVNITSTDTETLTVVAKNTGTATWSNNGSNPVRLGGSSPNDRSSQFYDGSWMSSSRPANLQESSVPPGSNGTFTFTIQAPSAGNYQERFNLLSEYNTWFQDPGMYFTINVTPATYSSQFVSDTTPGTLQAGTTGSGIVTYKNTSNVTWYKNGFATPKLGVYGHNSLYADSSWENGARAASMNESSVAPGDNATFNVVVKAPSAAGNYSDSFQPVIEGWSWVNPPFTKNLTVTGTYQAASNTSNPTITLGTNQTYNATVSFTNTGTATWINSGYPQMKLGLGNPFGKSNSSLAATNWLAPNRAAAMNEASVAPGATGTFNLSIKAPPSPGLYTETFDPVAEGLAWVYAPFTVTVNVVPANYSWQIVGQSYSNGSVNMSPGDSATLTLTAKNTGNTAWTKNGDFPIKLATTYGRDRNSIFNDGSWPSANRAATLNEDTVAPGANGTFTFNVKVPSVNGAYQEHFSLIAEGYTWMNDPGMYFFINATGQYSWQLVSQTYSLGSTNIAPGQTETLTVVAKNTGNATWYNTGNIPIRIGTNNPKSRTSSFYNGGWLSPVRPTTLTESSVAPGANGTFTFPITAPTTRGIYQEHYLPLAEGNTWFNDLGMYFYLNVQ